MRSSRTARLEYRELTAAYDVCRFSTHSIRHDNAPSVSWAERISQAGLAEVGTYFGKRGDVVLLPRLLPERAGLASMYCWPDRKPSVQLWRSVFERRAPASIAHVEHAMSGTAIGQGAMAPDVSDQLFEALWDAYVEAGQA
jgi:hypothetical protein